MLEGNFIIYCKFFLTFFNFSLFFLFFSAFENVTNPPVYGITNLFEICGFGSTTSRTSDELIKEIEELGGTCQLYMNREIMIFTIDVLRENLYKAIDILSDVILNATFEEEEVEQAKLISKYQHEGLMSNLISINLLHKAAFQDSPLGNLLNSFILYCFIFLIFSFSLIFLSIIR